MKLSYSSYKVYLDCPKQYKYESDKTPILFEPNMYFTLYGKLMESFFTRYANIDSKKDKELSEEEVRTVLQNLWEKVLKENYVDWSAPYVFETSQQIFAQAYDDTLKNLKAFTFWKYARSEVTIDVRLRNQDLLSSRLDFIVEYPDGKVEILDGKGTRKPDDNLDPDQLYFYGLMYLLHKGKIPDKVGFLLYRFQTVKYLDFDMETIKKFRDKLVLTKKAITSDTIFEPRVKITKQCRYCNYTASCDAFIYKKQANAEKRNMRKPEVIIEPIVDMIN